MRLIYSILFALATCTLFFSCQKELSTIDHIASGSMSKDASGNCLPINVVGTFTTGISLSSGNYADVQVNFSSPGTYEITSDTVNGYWFNAIGAVDNSGLSNVRMQGSGTPLVAGVDVFTIKYNNTQCEVNVVVTPGSSGTPAAVFTLGGSPGSCTGATVSGSYTSGIVLTASATVGVQVNINSPGTYTISTNTINGIFFSQSGTFITAGMQTVSLQGSGTPIAAGSYTYQIGSGGCSFNIIVTPASGPGLPVITTTAVTTVGTTSASGGGNISSDGGASVASRGVCWNTAVNPTIANNKTVDGTGTGIFTSNITGLASNTTYHIRAYATNSTGTAYGNDLSFATTTSGGGPGTVTDIDGTVYPTASYCGAVWMTQNLGVTKYNNGDPIPLVQNQAQWATLTTGAWCNYQYVTANGITYGKLYNWYAVNDPRGLAPAGWHVSSDADFSALGTCLGGESTAGGKMRTTGTVESGTGLWNAPNTGATNTSGFSAVPAGSCWNNGTFYGIGIDCTFWTSTLFSPTNAKYWTLGNTDIVLYGGIYGGTLQNCVFQYGNSVRCVKN